MTSSFKFALAAAVLAVLPAARSDAAFLMISPSGPIDVTQGQTPTLGFSVTLVADTPATDITGASAAIRLPDVAFVTPTTSDLSLGSLISTDFSPLFSVQDEGGGFHSLRFTAVVSDSSSNGFTLTSGQGELFSFSLTVKPTAPTGFWDVNLSPQVGNTPTGLGDVNGDDVTLAPAPTGGFDPGIDSQVRISAVPEPSSAALTALGALAALLGLRSRRRDA